MKKKRLSVGIIGDGGWGTTLAKVLAEKECAVTVWGPFPDYIRELSRRRVNRKFLPGVKLPKSINFTADLKKVVSENNYLVLAIPSQFLIKVLRAIRQCPYRGKTYISVVKGIENETFSTMSQLIEKELGHVSIAVLSGPTIAVEVAKRIPTAAVVASGDIRLMDELQQLFSCDYFRVYTNPDILGVEICGSVKNIIALACGLCDGLGFGTNTKAALLTRGLVEMTRLGRALRADPSTFIGLTGLGDLATTCFSPNSRNRYVGCELGKGRSLKSILRSMDAVAEGVVTAKAVYNLARKLRIEMPITEAVYGILYRGRSPSKAVADLMRRSLKSE